MLDPDNTASAVSAGCHGCATGSSNRGDAYRSAANIEMLERRGPKPMPRHVTRGNARRARIRSAVEHVFAAQKYRLALVIRTIGQARATAKLALANLAYNFKRLAWPETRTAA